MRALPGWAIDAITTGVPTGLRGKERYRAVQQVLVRTARSAIRHHWTRQQWESLILNDGRTRRTLADQLRWDGTKVVKEAAVLGRLSKAWRFAAELPWNDDWERQEAVAHLAAQAATAAADANASLSDAERAVLRAFGDQALAMCMTKVAFPWRTASERSGCSEWRTKEALKGLSDKGFLVMAARGERRREGKPPKASIYVAGPLLRTVPASHRPEEQLWEGVRNTTMGGRSERAAS